MIKVIQIHKDCIGCGTCVALCPAFWEMTDDGKARPAKGAKNPETSNYEFEVEKVGCNKDASDACPVQIIKIV